MIYDRALQPLPLSESDSAKDETSQYACEQLCESAGLIELCSDFERLYESANAEHGTKHLRKLKFPQKYKMQAWQTTILRQCLLALFAYTVFYKLFFIEIKDTGSNVIRTVSACS